MTAISESPPVDLASLAAIWATRWLAYGGSLMVDENCDRLSVSMACEGWEWRSKNPHGPVQRNWQNGWLVGRWRELQELLPLVPGLREAIIEHVVETGDRKGTAGWWLYRPKPSVGWN